MTGYGLRLVLALGALTTVVGVAAWTVTRMGPVDQRVLDASIGVVTLAVMLAMVGRLDRRGVRS